MKRNQGGRGIKSVYDTVKSEEQQVCNYLRHSPEELMGPVAKILNMKEEEQQNDRYGMWTGKIMNGQFVRHIEDKSSEETWLWMRRGTIKRETESLITAAQDQALRTNYRRARIEKDGTSPTCRMCQEANETVTHIVSGCKKLAQTDYKARHDRVATAVHWCLAKKYGFTHTNQWYEHRAEPVMENEQAKLLWDFNIYTDHVIEARRPDIVVVRKDKKECQVIDIAVPGDLRVEDKEDEKCDKYQDLCREIGRLWEVRCIVIPVVVGALGTIPRRLPSYLGILDINLSVEIIQKSVILGTARILRKVLERSSFGRLRL